MNNKKIALVTGAGMGIGAVIALGLAQDGYLVIVSDVNSHAADETVAGLKAQGLDAWGLAMDVGSPDSIKSAFAEIAERYGRCDVLVNNAGVAKTIPFMDYPLDHWELTMRINVTGPLLCAQYAACLMMKFNWGRIINMASISGLRAGAGRTAYGTSKAAVIGLTRQMAVELAPFGITANSVAPGPIDTPMTVVLHSEATRENYKRTIPSRRYGTPEEVSSAVRYLASEGAAYVTGHVLPVDGGFVAAGVLEI